MLAKLRGQHFRLMILAQLASDDVPDSAYEWLCRRRRDYSANADVWSFRREGTHEKKRIRDELRAGSYRFSLLMRITRKDGEEIYLWSARDALVLKGLVLVLGSYLPPSRRCTHLIRCGRSAIISPPTASCCGPT